jgi:putative acetyltransferase
VEDRDSEVILRILGEVYAEYEGCFLELGEVSELIEPATSFAAMNGAMWVALDDDGRVIGFTAMAPSAPAGRFELKKLYLHKSARGRGLGRALIRLVEDEVARRGGRVIHLWSDTRFLTAHQVYARAGYEKLPETRELHDVSNSTEFHFEKTLP